MAQEKKEVKKQIFICKFLFSDFILFYFFTAITFLA